MLWAVLLTLLFLLALSSIKVESGFDPHAISKEGARGLMQIIPSTGWWLAQRLDLPYEDLEDLYEPGNHEAT